MSPCHYDGYLDPTSVENRICDDGIGASRCDVDDSRLLSGAMLKLVVSYHTQIKGPVHGATTHENSTTMSLCGYGMS
jgi:hypothetical protein